ncbi:prepilin peptidase [Candidatus Babeliales bacterium]|nr:prepilin peptidase [Candidatus Babeliales bacterium]MBP9844181.1 prepilin peptidase [Candidatus Babeliales bacterium]
MIAAILIFLAWGSYLNSLGYRLLNLEHFFKVRSFCPHCHHQINWYDNIPVISWLWLKAQCRFCKQPISWLYPFIELVSTFSLFFLWQTVPTHYFPTYFLFFSALIVTLRTDCDQMLISRFVTLYLLPAGFCAAAFNFLPLSFNMALLGAICGYVVLWCAKTVAYLITKQECLGQGDLELLAFIGAFTGPCGAWITMLVGSVLGTVISTIFMITTQQKIEKIPLGAFLSCGAMTFVLFQQFFMTYFFAA